jgi:hypothetical protein
MLKKLYTISAIWAIACFSAQESTTLQGLEPGRKDIFVSDFGQYYLYHHDNKNVAAYDASGQKKNDFFLYQEAQMLRQISQLNLYFYLPQSQELLILDQNLNKMQDAIPLQNYAAWVSHVLVEDAQNLSLIDAQSNELVQLDYRQGKVLKKSIWPLPNLGQVLDFAKIDQKYYFLLPQSLMCYDLHGQFVATYPQSSAKKIMVQGKNIYLLADEKIFIFKNNKIELFLDQKQAEAFAINFENIFWLKNNTIYSKANY